MTIRIALLGNCQAQLLEGMFQASVSGIVVDSLCPNYQMTDDMRHQVTAKLHRSDVVFAQRVSSDYPRTWLTPAYLKETLGSKVFIWPNIYFDGYTPSVHYIYLSGWGKLQSPLEDYHLREVVDGFKRGRTVAETTALLTSAEAIVGGDPFVNAFRSLEVREADVDIKISDYLQENVYARRSLYTPNHPYNFVLAEMARRLAQAANLEFDSQVAITTFPVRLDRIYIPTSPWVVRRYHLSFDQFQLYHGLDVVRVLPGVVAFGRSRSFYPTDLVEQFYKVYDVAFAEEARLSPPQSA